MYHSLLLQIIIKLIYLAFISITRGYESKTIQLTVLMRCVVAVLSGVAYAI